MCTAAPSIAKEQQNSLAAMLECASVDGDAERLACFDREAAKLQTKLTAKDLRVITRDDVTQTRRTMFGFAMPKIEALDDGGDGDSRIEKLNTTITRVSNPRRRDWIIEVAEGSVWQVTNAPMRFFPPKVGQAVEIERAALGSFWVRVNGQYGVKGKRIE